MHAIAVTIGRNAGESQQPLSALAWEAYRRRLRDRIEGYGGDVWVANVGTGWWNDQPEDNFVVVAGIDPEAVPYLEDDLVEIAADYGQETVALLTGHSSLLAAEVPVSASAGRRPAA